MMWHILPYICPVWLVCMCTYYTQCARYWYWPLSIELTYVFACIRLLHFLDHQKPGISGKFVRWIKISILSSNLLSKLEVNLSFWATISGYTAMIPFSECSHATWNINWWLIIWNNFSSINEFASFQTFENSILQYTQLYNHLKLPWIIIKFYSNFDIVSEKFF